MTRIVKVLSLALVLLACDAATLHAQNCKWVKEKKDPFTKEVVRTAAIYIPDSWQLTMERKGDEYRLGVNVSMTGLMDERMQAGRKIMFKLSNDEVYELVLDKDYDPIVEGGGGVVTKWHIMVSIPKADFKKFRHNTITAIRTTIHGEDKLLEIGDRAGGKIKDTFECMMQG